MPRAADEPVRLTRIYTRGGDAGETSLGDGSRVSKLDARIAAFGTTDELNSLLGVVLAGDCPAELRGPLGRIQNELFDVGADLCVPLEVEGRLRVEQAMVDRLEALVRRLQRGSAGAEELRAAGRNGGLGRPSRRPHRLPPGRARDARRGPRARRQPARRRLPQPPLRPPVHPRARSQRARRRRRAALEARGVPVAGSAGEVFRAALRLGLTSFGGPVAHIGYFHDEYVTRRQWIGAQEFGELVALSNILPGPSSSQVGIAVGVHRAGKLGGLAAWIGFTLPSAVILTALAIWARDVDLAGAGWVHGLELAAAAVVLTAVIAMARTLARGPVKAVIAVAAAAVALLFPGTFGQVATILVAGAVGAFLFRGRMSALPLTLAFPISRRRAIVCAQLLVLLFFVPLWLANAFSSHSLRLFDSLLQRRRARLRRRPRRPAAPQRGRRRSRVGVPAGVSGRVRRRPGVPGPLFTFSAYLGAIEDPSPNGVAGAAIALVAIFLPSFLLLGVALPLWSAARERTEIQAAVAGIGAAVVGLLAAALWDPVLSTSVHGVGDAAVVVVLFLLLRVLPPWAVVGIAALAGAVLF